MLKAKVEYKIQNATEQQIDLHLRGCSENFIPPLATRLDIKNYSRKIFDKAVTFEAWSDNILVGLIAAYFNDYENKKAFITNVSVLKKFMGLGIARKLLDCCIQYAKQKKTDMIILEVNRNNEAAIALYKKFHFTESDTKDEMVIMKAGLT